MPNELTRHLAKFSQKLIPEDQERDKFLDAILRPKRFPQALIWVKERPEKSPFALEEPLTWQPSFVDRVASDSYAGRNPLHEEGYYYCLDFSSIFEISLISEMEYPPKLVIDVCSAPGGKGVFSWRLYQPERLILNEVIRKRTGALISNAKRCGLTNYEITSYEAERLSEIFAGQAQLVIVDAPCTGQSLRAKGQDAFGCFDPRLIAMNAKRQRKILANAAATLATGGYLLYSTCSYSKEENEDNLTWFVENFRQFTSVQCSDRAQWQSPFTALACYRMWPQHNLGAGGFAALLRKIS